MSKVILKVEVDEEAYKQIKGDSVYDNNNKSIVSKSSSAFNALNAIINATPLTESDDAVSRKAVLDEVRAIAVWHTGDAFNEDRILTHMKMLSPVTPQRERGEWIGVNPMVDTLMCSKCGENIISEEFKSNYCPNCGAEMR